MQTFLRFFITTVLISSSIAAFASGPAPEASPVPPQRSGVYVDLSAGYAAIDWGNFKLGPFNGYNTFGGSVNDNDTGGFTFGFDVGYQINNLLGLEVGWYYLPTVEGNSNIATSLPSLTLDSWLAYLALKVMVPFSNRFGLFLKTGLGYRSSDCRGSATSFFGFGTSNTDYFSGVFGGGFQYYFNDKLSVSAQYLYMLDKKSGDTIPRFAPSANIITASVGYIFSV